MIPPLSQRPGTDFGIFYFHTQGKAKKKSWQKYVDEGLTVDEAKEKYVALVEEMKTKYGYDANKVPEAVGGSS